MQVEFYASLKGDLPCESIMRDDISSEDFPHSSNHQTEETESVIKKIYILKQDSYFLSRHAIFLTSIILVSSHLAFPSDCAYRQKRKS